MVDFRPVDSSCSAHVDLSLGYLRANLNPLLVTPLSRFFSIPQSHLAAAQAVEQLLEQEMERPQGLGTSLAAMMRDVALALEYKPARVRARLAGIQLVLVQPPTSLHEASPGSAFSPLRRRQVSDVGGPRFEPSASDGPNLLRMLLVRLGTLNLETLIAGQVTAFADSDDGEDTCSEDDEEEALLQAEARSAAGSSPAARSTAYAAKSSASTADERVVTAVIHDTSIALLPPTDLTADWLATLPGDPEGAPPTGYLIEPFRIEARVVVRLATELPPEVPRLTAALTLGSIRCLLRESALRELTPLFGTVLVAIMPLQAASNQDSGSRSDWLEITELTRPKDFEYGRSDIRIAYGRVWVVLRKKRLTFVTSVGKHHHLHLHDLLLPRLTKDGLGFELAVDETTLRREEPSLVRKTYILRCTSQSDANLWVSACAAMQTAAGRNVRSRRGANARFANIGVEDSLSLANPSVVVERRRRTLFDEAEGPHASPWQHRRQQATIGDQLIVQLAVSLSVHELSIVLPVDDAEAIASDASYQGGNASFFGGGGGGYDRGSAPRANGSVPPHVLHLQLLGLGAHVRMRPLDMDVSAHLLALVAGCGQAPPAPGHPHAPRARSHCSPAAAIRL